MDILIVDDEPLARARLARLLESFTGYQVVGEAADSISALDLINKNDPDIIFLDVCMPGENGIDLAKQIGELDDPPVIIFCSAHEQYAVDAFSTLAVGYLLKPIHKDALTAVLEKAKTTNRLQRAHLAQAHPNLAEKPRAFISTRTRKGIVRIPLDNIYYFVADQKYVSVFHSQGESLIDQSLKELEILFADQVIRSHRNTLINKRYLIGMEKAGNGQFVLRLDNCEHKPHVSRRHLADVRQWIVSLQEA